LRYAIIAGAISASVAAELQWCHVHRYRVAGMTFHSGVRCHRHGRWNEPSIRYVRVR
jgi:hypothetical protein